MSKTFAVCLYQVFAQLFYQKGKPVFTQTFKNMKASNRYGYYLEDIFGTMQWVDAEKHSVEDISYFQLKGSIVVQLFDKGEYIGCAVTTDDFRGIMPLSWLDRRVRFMINNKISAIPLSQLKIRNNGKPYDETID